MQIAVVRDGERRLFELQRAIDEVINPVRAVQKRIFGMAMQVNE
jgi:hypothetical protein